MLAHPQLHRHRYRQDRHGREMVAARINPNPERANNIPGTLQSKEIACPRHHSSSRAEFVA